MDTSKHYILMCKKAEEIQTDILKQQNNDSIVYCPHCDKIFDFEFDGFMWLENYGNRDKCEQFVSDYYTSDNPTFHGKEAVWLPRQDQLQSLLVQLDGEDLSIFDLAEHHKIDAFHQFVFPDYQGIDSYKSDIERVAKQTAYVSQFKTLEQLWLVFMMFNNHNKIFDGKDWVKK